MLRAIPIPRGSGLDHPLLWSRCMRASTLYPVLAIAWLVVLRGLSPSVCRAQYNNAQSVPPTLSLEEARELAPRSLRGPRTRIALGSLILTATPLIFSVTYFAAFDGNHELAIAKASTAVTGALGAVLLVSGIRGVTRIHRARRTLARAPCTLIDLGPRHAALNLSLRF
jgi:hypothetical protein